MKWIHTQRSWQAAPAGIQKAFDKQVRLLAQNLRHPSLRAKKYRPELGIWQARVTRDWRFYFQIQQDRYIILTITRHPKWAGETGPAACKPLNF